MFPEFHGATWSRHALAKFVVTVCYDCTRQLHVMSLLHSSHFCRKHKVHTVLKWNRTTRQEGWPSRHTSHNSSFPQIAKNCESCGQVLTHTQERRPSRDNHCFCMRPSPPWLALATCQPLKRTRTHAHARTHAHTHIHTHTHTHQVSFMWVPAQLCVPAR
jgi:hypothetical protein